METADDVNYLYCLVEYLSNHVSELEQNKPLLCLELITNLYTFTNFKSITCTKNGCHVHYIWISNKKLQNTQPLLRAWIL